LFEFDFPEFVASRVIRGGHPQTVCGAWLPGPGEPAGTARYAISTTLDDLLVLHHNPAAEPTPDRRQVLLLHGLSGCHASAYMQRSCRRLIEAGFGVWRLDARGSGAGMGLARHHHHAARHEDLQAAVDFLSSQFPGAPVSVAGFSLGGNVLLNWLASPAAGQPSVVDSAIAVAPPIDLFCCSAGLKCGLSRGYDYYFVKKMLQQLRQRRRARPDMVDFPIRRTPESLADFDRQFTAPAGGFASLDDYYESASSWTRLAGIRIPTLILIDEQDPVIPVRMFDSAPLSNAVTVVRTRGGGHLGYIARPGSDPDCHWLSWRIADAVLKTDRQFGAASTRVKRTRTNLAGDAGSAAATSQSAAGRRPPP
jgi:predicted alpha/beta-fold hydrolase